MDAEVARRLNRLNQDFYAREAASFSRTRRVGWPGWVRLARVAGQVNGAALAADAANRAGLANRAADGAGLTADAADCGTAVRGGSFRVLDLACGNLRFGRFLEGELPAGTQLEYHAVDSCPQLVGGWRPAGGSLDYQNLDVVSSLLEGNLDARLTAPACDLVVAMGFLHHVPTAAARLALLRGLLARTVPGGVCAVSFWRFMTDEKLARRARQTTVAGLADLGLRAEDLEPGDYLVGWQNQAHVFRYCHSFGDEEAARMAAEVSDAAKLVDQFCADGRTGRMNGYLILRKE